jgi:hypothetical protein
MLGGALVPEWPLSIVDGPLAKFAGSRHVAGGLLWVALPPCVLSVRDPVMTTTATRIEAAATQDGLLPVQLTAAPQPDMVAPWVGKWGPGSDAAAVVPGDVPDPRRRPSNTTEIHLAAWIDVDNTRR